MRVFPIGHDRLAEFIAAGEVPYRADIHHIPALRAPLEAELSGRSTFAAYGTLQPFLVERESRVVGRAAALLNPRLKDGDAPCGQIGWFECADDLDAARALFEACDAWLRERGARKALGPMNGGAHRLHRLMVAGFERTPFLFEPRNPPYYVKLFESCGWQRVFTWHSFDVPRDQAATALARVQRVMELRPPKGHIDLLDPSKPAETMGRVHALLDGVWSDHLGYASISLEELAEVFGGALALMTERNIGVFVADGVDVACGFTYPDRAAEVRALHGDVSGYSGWRGAPVSRVVLHTTAAIPEARGRRGILAIFERGLRYALEDGAKEVILGMVVDGLWFGLAEPTRSYALYSRSL